MTADYVHMCSSNYDIPQQCEMTGVCIYWLNCHPSCQQMHSSTRGPCVDAMMHNGSTAPAADQFIGHREG